MRRLTLTLLLLIAVTASCMYLSEPSTSINHSMTLRVATQAQLDAANQRVLQFKHELLPQGFREVSAQFLNSTDLFTLQGDYGTLEDLRVTL